ncbi:carbonic anhydrase [Actinophytocola sp.]|uniref:carbonic anhydrase n=1 Tax=Actinophytocola sp. TaxID=1872138 RepID=UPI002D803258|nr:carbonic anhydrase [Actinophytocola sp.]HET9139455.1 carbonic anhydrase [Actinophytocola sp.]
MNGHPVSRRSLFALGTATTVGMLAGPAVALAAPDPPDPAAAWRALAVGNIRFTAGCPDHPHQDSGWRETLLAEQHPIACVLSCADSRVGPELVFDQGLGDLFTVRTAGAVIDDAVAGSVEYAVLHLRVPLVVVLGHSGCGAVRAAIDLVRGATITGAVGTLARAVEAAVRATPAVPDDAAFHQACVLTHTRRVAAELPARCPAIAAREVPVVAAGYDLATGVARRLD